MSDVARTADYPPSKRLDYWRGVLSEAFVPLDAMPLDDSVDGLAGTLRCDTLGALRVADVSGTNQQVRRHRRLIRRNDPGLIKIGLQVHGSGVLVQGGREVRLRPGDLAAYDTSRSYYLSFPRSFRMLVVMCPRSMLSLPESSIARLTAVRIPGDRGVGALISPFISGLGAMFQDSPDELNGGVDHHLAESVMEMITAGFRSLDGGEVDGTVAGSAPTGLLMRARSHIEANLHSPELNSAGIAAAHHISVRYLQKLFEQDGWTVSSWIRVRRLDHCRRDLRDPARAHLPVSEVAARWGLVDAAHFSRSFRATYGISPSEYRRAGSVPPPPERDRHVALIGS
jgi:AraC-like DNA-binding protein